MPHQRTVEWDDHFPWLAGNAVLDGLQDMVNLPDYVAKK